MEARYAAGDVAWHWVDTSEGDIGGFDDPFSRVAGLVAATRPRIQRSMEARSAAGDVAWHWVDADEGDIGGIVDLFSGVVWAAKSPLPQSFLRSMECRFAAGDVAWHRLGTNEGDIGGFDVPFRRVA